MTLRAQIEEAARGIGFDATGIAPAALPESAEAFHRWLDAGHHGDMAYMADRPQRRANPKVYWPEAKTLVVCVRSYAPSAHPEPGPLEGQTSAYAWGKDYHYFLKKDLHKLGKAIEAMMPGVTYRAVIDTSALLERAHAVAAGLGWSAKNTMLLSRDLGSYTLIGAVLLDRALTPDVPTTAHCGSCRACIDACPTDAILDAHVLDARRCISYLTIELRRDIPVEHRAAMGSWVFGCDICQQVCPWVQRAGPAATLGKLAPIGDRPTPDLGNLLHMDASEFALWAQRNPMKRPKLAGMQRNAAVCLGNSPDRDGAVEILADVLKNHSEPMVRRHAAWALGAQGGRPAREALQSRLPKAEGDEAQAIEDALAASGEMPRTEDFETEGWQCTPKKA